MVLGSGFNGSVSQFDVLKEIGYDRLPGFPRPRVAGHLGKVVLVRFHATPVLMLCGRAHFYEGHSMADITFPIRVLGESGVRALLLTNSAGGINPRFHPGDFMCVTDHINFMGANPLREPPSASLSGFLDLSEVYDPALNRCLKAAGKQAKARVHAGVYIAVSGPSYETPAEIRAFARLGADAVGMSTVPEAIVARQHGMRVAALSCITNRASGRNHQPISHTEVLAVGNGSQTKMSTILARFVDSWGASQR